MKRLIRMILTVLMIVCVSVPGFAGTWKQDARGWWYENDNGTYTTNAWQTIDGIEYYFGSDGYLLTNTTTPDGFKVDANGAKVLQAAASSSTAAKSTASSGNTDNAASAGTVYITATGSKYHSIPNCGRTNPAKTSKVTVEKAEAMGMGACSKCF